ncbi:MAG TPA: sigma-70 family RNA polymerase sigma factor, partial [Gemmataceae bacterium]|nr:sigma-70 family RNA polymerase sigma factor [Gemmataceae bacterium]
SPLTRPSLLVRIRDARDGAAWSQFVTLYAPLIYGHARKHALQDADAADLTQDVLRAVAGAVHRLDYDPRRGSFRGWLFTIVRHKLRNFLAPRGRQLQGSSDTAAIQVLEQLAAPEEEQWEADYQRQLLAWAIERIRSEFQEKTWQAFRQMAVEGRSGKEVAASLGMSVAAVYLAKGRVLARLKEEIAQLRDD